MAWLGLARAVVAGCVLAGGIAALAAPAQAPGFPALSGLERGQWQLREQGGASRSVCLGDPTSLFQQRHRGVQCSRFVIDNGATSATVHYTCPGAGHGRTTITVETPRLVRIESQGLDGGAPFAFEVEGRRTGACTRGS
jgi:hypothetical protein